MIADFDETNTLPNNDLSYDRYTVRLEVKFIDDIVKESVWKNIQCSVVKQDD